MARRKEGRAANGEGSIYIHKRDEQGKPTRYAGYITLPNGKPHYVYGKTKKEVTAKLNDLKAAVRQGAAPRGKITVQQWLDEWMARYVEGKEKSPCFCQVKR